MRTIDRITRASACVVIFAVPIATVLLAVIVRWFDREGFWYFR